MPSLDTVGRRFENDMIRADGYPFKAAVMPHADSVPSSYDFTELRSLIRVRAESIVGTGDVVIDPAGRRYILADFDANPVANTIVYRTHLAYPVNRRPLWQRESAGVIDPLTKLRRAGERVTLGQIDALIEVFGREDMDPSMKVREQTRRLVTNVPIQLNDIVEDMVVKRVDASLGIWVAEIE
jgi:hypothetical protein